MKKFILIVSLFLTACGGGGGDSSSPQAVIDNCVIVENTQKLPDTYNGQFNIPVATQTLSNNILRSIGFKDYHPYTPNGSLCTDRLKYIKNLYASSLDKLKATGVDTVWIYNYASWEDITLNVWTINKETYQIPEDHLTLIVNEANKRNIKVYLAWQFHAYDKKGNTIPIGSNITYWQMRSILASHHNNMVNIAKYAQTVGIAGIAVDWNAYHISNLSDYKEQYITAMSNLIDEMRLNFNGKLTYGQVGSLILDNRITSKIDALHLSVGARLTDIENQSLSVDLVKTKMLGDIALAYYANQLDQYTPVPIIWEIAIQSNRDYFINGWVEDGFCVNSCIQNNYTTDFSVQAIGTEAALQAVTSQWLVNTFMVNFHSSYWHTNTLVSGEEGFPNLSQSVRGKPAEKIIKQWFSKP